MRLELAQESPDFRSRQMAIRLQARNPNAAPVQIQDIDLRVPTGVRVVEIGDPIASRTTPPVEKLCAQLERLLAAQLGLISADDFLIAPYRTGLRPSPLRPLLVRPVLWLADTWRYLKTRIRGDDLSPAFARADLVTRTGMVQEIHTLEDAENAWVRFFLPDLVAAERAERRREAERGTGVETERDDGPEFSNILHQAFFAVMTQLSHRQGRLLRVAPHALVPASVKRTGDDQIDRSDPLVLAGEGETSKAYLLECRRSLFVSRIYTVTVEVIFQAYKPFTTGPLSSNPRMSNERTLSLTVSPNPVSVTLFAALGGALGSALNPIDGRDPWSMVWSADGLKAVTLAVVFFNIFEFTSLAERFRQATSWRGALLIGVLCGLGSGRVIESLTGLLQVKTG